MANVIYFNEAKEKLVKCKGNGKRQFEYAFHTGACPECGRLLVINHTCSRCKMITMECDCGWVMTRV
jgi:predicted RNA-binding Zn-ribbon protein involved in translation (DUF1610 family)